MRDERQFFEDVLKRSKEYLQELESQIDLQVISSAVTNVIRGCVEESALFKENKTRIDFFENKSFMIAVANFIASVGTGVTDTMKEALKDQEIEIANFLQRRTGGIH